MNDLQFGDIIVATQGFGSIEKGREYHYVNLSPNQDQVLLIAVLNPPPKRCRVRGPRGEKLQQVKMRSQSRDLTTIPVQVSRADFEDEIHAGNFRIVKKPSMPTCLSSEVYADDCPTATKRWNLLQPLLETLPHSLMRPDLRLAINKLARAAGKNPTRVWHWFWLGVLFGKRALVYRRARIGHWTRPEDNAGRKFGRPSYKGKKYGFRMTIEMKKAILIGYEEFSVLRAPMTDIWGQTLVKHFDCRQHKNEFGKLSFASKGDKPFPTFEQFKYVVKKEFSLDEIQKRRFGEARFRNRISADVGSFREGIANLLEVAEADAYATADAPTGSIYGKGLKPLYVVRLRCRLGMLVGIGFSFASETNEAYREALFCAAIKKSVYCRLMGLPNITDNDWPCHGIPLQEVTDRGPGAVDDAWETETPLLARKTGTPAYSPRSKAGVESANPKTLKLEGAPSHQVSPLSIFGMMRREILRLVELNQTLELDFSPPADVLPLVHGPTPIDLWKAMAHLGRNLGKYMELEDAVRSYLPKEEAVITKQGLFLLGQLYTSSDDAFKALKQSAMRTRRHVDVYVMFSSVRHVWLDHNGTLIELALQLPYQSDESGEYLTLYDLREKAEYEKSLSRGSLENRVATKMKNDEEFKAIEGHARDTGKLVRGRKKLTAASRDETKQIKDRLQRRPV